MENDGEVKQVVCGDFNGDGTTDIAIKGIATTLLTIVTYTSHLEKAMVVFTYN